MSIMSGLIAAAPAPTKEAVEEAVSAIQQANNMRIALITIAALAAVNLLLVILIVSRRKKKAE